MSKNISKKRLKKSVRVTLVILILVAALTAVFFIYTNSKKGNSSDDSGILDKIRQGQSSSDTGASDLTGTNDITGLPIAKENENKRPVAVMINNIEQAQPLIGVSQADAMYECLVEGAITRIMSVFKDYPSVGTIGSVRSARPYFINIADGIDAIYVHVGGSDKALSMLKTGKTDSFDLGSYSDMMWRDSNRRANLGYEHSAVTSGEKLKTGINSSSVRQKYNSGYKSAQKFSDKSQVLQGQSCQDLKVQFSSYKNTLFEYNQEKNTYMISQFGEPQIDANTKEQNSKQNIVAIYVNTYSDNGSILQKMDLVGNGGGYYANSGKIIPIKWSRKTLTLPFVYTTEKDEPLIMTPGQMYVCCVPFDGSITYN